MLLKVISIIIRYLSRFSSVILIVKYMTKLVNKYSKYFINICVVNFTLKCQLKEKSLSFSLCNSNSTLLTNKWVITFFWQFWFFGLDFNLQQRAGIFCVHFIHLSCVSNKFKKCIHPGFLNRKEKHCHVLVNVKKVDTHFILPFKPIHVKAKHKLIVLIIYPEDEMSDGYIITTKC